MTCRALPPLGPRASQGNQGEMLRTEGERLAGSYINYYICNGGVVMAAWGIPEADARWVCRNSAVVEGLVCAPAAGGTGPGETPPLLPNKTSEQGRPQSLKPTPCPPRVHMPQGKGGDGGGLPRPQGGAGAHAGHPPGRWQCALHHAATARGPARRVLNAGASAPTATMTLGVESETCIAVF